MSARRVTATQRDSAGVIVALCNEGEEWSPRTKDEAIRDIENVRHSYYVEINQERAEIEVATSQSGKYFRTAADGLEALPFTSGPNDADRDEATRMGAPATREGLDTCEVCGQELSAKASVCPTCGDPKEQQARWSTALVLFLIVAGSVVAFTSKLAFVTVVILLLVLSVGLLFWFSRRIPDSRSNLGAAITGGLIVALVILVMDGNIRDRIAQQTMDQNAKTDEQTEKLTADIEEQTEQFGTQFQRQTAALGQQIQLSSIEDLTKSNLPGQDLSGLNLFGTDLTGSNFFGSNLTGSNFSDTIMSQAVLSTADLSDSIFLNANLSGANLFGSIGTRANFAFADLTNAVLANVNWLDANLLGATLAGADLESANLTGAILTDADLTSANLVGVAGLTSSVLDGVTWFATVCPDGSESGDTDGDGFTCLLNLRPISLP